MNVGTSKHGAQLKVSENLFNRLGEYKNLTCLKEYGISLDKGEKNE